MKRPDADSIQTPPRARPRKLILASASPRRRELLIEYGYDFEVIPPPLAEPDEPAAGLAPAAFAESVSFFKAKSVAAGVDDGVILAADTIVTCRGGIFGKPANCDHARAILRSLSGTTHQVITGVTLLNARTRAHWIGHDATAVTMRPLSDAQVEAYLTTDAWRGKAGAYGIQDRGDAFIERIGGSFTNVVGLPMELVNRMLAEWGVPPKTV